MENVTEYMNFEKALEVVKELSHSQGFYCRMLETMSLFSEEQKQEFTMLLKENNVKTDLDLIYYFEC